MLPAQLGRVDLSVMKAIEAEVEQAAAATGSAPADNEPSSETPQGASEEDAPSEDELNESDDERQASARGVGDDENSTDALALEKAGLIDLEDPDQLERVDTYVEVTVNAAGMFAEKQKADSEKGGRRNSTQENSKDANQFLSDLLPNLDEAVELVDEQEKLGVLTPDLFEKTLEDSQNAPVTNSNLQKVKNAGVDDVTALQSLVSEPKNSDEAAEFIDEALKVDPAEDPSSAAIKLGAVARSTSVADKMKEAKDEGIAPDTIIDSAVAVAEIEIQAEQEQAALVNSGTEIDPALIDQINSATDENSINTLLDGKENETYYDQLVKLKDSRVKVIEAARKKTKISTTIKAADSRNKNIEKKRQKAQQLKDGIPVDVVTALDEADISSSDKVDALKADYEERYKSEVLIFESISTYIDNLKSAYDLENKKLTSFVEEVDSIETILAATTDDADFDLTDSLIQIEEVAETFELLESEDGAVDLVAAANLAKNASEIDESKKLITGVIEAKKEKQQKLDSGEITAEEYAASVDSLDITKMASKDIKEQKAINKAVEDQKTAVDNQRQENEQLAKDAGLSDDLLALLNAKDVSTDDNVQTVIIEYAGDPLASKIEEYILSRRKAYKLENTDLTKLAETSQTLAVLYESTADNTDFDIKDSLAEIEEVQATFELLSEDGEIDVNNFDAEAVANIAANAADIKDSREAIQLAKDAGIDVKEVAKKDIQEQKAIKNVATKIKEAGGGGDVGDEAVKKFLASGATDDVLQYEKALEDDPELAGNIVTVVTETSGDGETDVPVIDFKAKIEEKVKESAGSKLESDYADTEYLSIIESNNDRAQDISFALSFVEKGSPQEKALFANIDKLDAIISLGILFKDDDEKLTAVFNNLDYSNALNALAKEFKNQPSRIDLIFENPELSPAVLSAYTDFKSTGSKKLINDLFESSESMKTTVSNDGINKLRQKYPQYDSELTKYEDRAGEINALLKQFEPNEFRVNFILSNLDSFDVNKGSLQGLKQVNKNWELYLPIRGISHNLKNFPTG